MIQPIGKRNGYSRGNQFIYAEGSNVNGINYVTFICQEKCTLVQSHVTQYGGDLESIPFAFSFVNFFILLTNKMDSKGYGGLKLEVVGSVVFVFDSSHLIFRAYFDYELLHSVKNCIVHNTPQF